ncbi:MAG: hypothetical protein ACKODP_08175 [Actinomycetota bacterium]
MLLAEVFGFVAAVLGVLQAWPQTVRVRRLGHGRGVSLAMWLMMSGSSSVWLGYGLRIGSPSLIVSTLATGAMNMTVVLALRAGSRGTLPGMVLGFATGTAAIALLPPWFAAPVLYAFTLSRMPQVVRSWKSRRDGVTGSAVSLGSVGMSMACLMCWEVYSVLHASPVLIGTTTVALCTNIAVAWLELGNRASARRVPAA